MLSEETYTDNQLLHLIAACDQNAFDILYRRYRGKVSALALRLTHSPTSACDITQEVFMKIWINHQMLGGIGNFKAYLHTLTGNFCCDVLRKQAGEKACMRKLSVVPTLCAGDDPAEKRDLLNVLHAALCALPAQQRKVFELSRMEGMKHREIASQLQISKETVKKHMMQALITLRCFLIRKGY